MKNALIVNKKSKIIVLCISNYSMLQCTKIHYEML